MPGIRAWRRELEAELERFGGGRIEHTGRHLVLVLTNGARVYTSATPSDWRAIRWVRLGGDINEVYERLLCTESPPEIFVQFMGDSAKTREARRALEKVTGITIIRDCREGDEWFMVLATGEHWLEPVGERQYDWGASEIDLTELQTKVTDWEARHDVCAGEALVAFADRIGATIGTDVAWFLMADFG